MKLYLPGMIAHAVALLVVGYLLAQMGVMQDYFIKGGAALFLAVVLIALGFPILKRGEG
jgi:hypothetical protein